MVTILMNDYPKFKVGKDIALSLYLIFWATPPFAIAHTFCASQDGPRYSVFLRTVPTNSKVFLHGL